MVGVGVDFVFPKNKNKNKNKNNKNNINNNLAEGDQNLQSVSGGGEAANLPLLPENPIMVMGIPLKKFTGESG